MRFFTKVFSIVCLSLLLGSAARGAAAEEITDPAADDAPPKAAVVVVNRAQLGAYKGRDLDADATEQIRAAIGAALRDAYQIVEPYETEYLLKKAAIDDPLAAPQGAVADALAPTDAAYIILAELRPVQNKNHQAMFKFTVESTGTLKVTVLDAVNRTTVLETEYRRSAEKSNPVSYNQVIPLAIEQLAAALQEDLQEKIAAAQAEKAAA